MDNYSDRLISAIEKKGNACIIGLDPRIDMMPDFVENDSKENNVESKITDVITNFHKLVIDQIADLVPAVKPQVAFYEQYGVAGMKSFENTVAYAKKKGLLVVVDAKRNDIGSTAEAYSNTFLGRTNIFGQSKAIYDVDCITVAPFLGEDSLMPFIKDCREYGKGIFILVKTSNPGSVDLQDLKSEGEEIYIRLAKMVNRLGKSLIGKKGYSSIGAVVGATFPEEADVLREIMKENYFLVPGYGAQGGSGKDVVNCFNVDNLGSIVNASRSITYNFGDKSISKDEFEKSVEDNTVQMINDIESALKHK
ncbi:MAG: orotidine-5'-phosphate decarboxylase [Saprospiraceae bacterium]|nr:orotidine-5'-phosphate decarboxylase [Saprospiraceae bacterium]